MKILITLCLVSLCTEGYAQEFARILEHETTYTIHENAKAEIEEHYRIQILSELGQHFGIYEEYLDKFRKIANISLDVFDHNGKKIKRLKRIDGVEFGLSPANEITDGTILTIKPDYKEFPFTVEVNAKINLDGFVSLPAWIPRSQFHLAVDQSRLTVIRPVSTKINFWEENVGGTTVTKDSKMITTYVVTGLQSVDNKVRYHDFYAEQPKVLSIPAEFRLDNAPGSSASWRDFGNWFYSLNDEPYRLSQKTTQYIDGLGKDDKRKLIQDIYEYMQDRTRYVSIQLGIGGFRALPTKDVEDYGYGDCKALSMYMKNMLDYAGVSANYVLAHAGSDVPDVISEFPSNQFNHVFLGVPLNKDTVYLECTSQIMPVDYLGSFTDDRNVLWVRKDKSAIVRSRVYSHGQNMQHNFVGISLDTEGNGTADFDIFNQGIFFDEIQLFKLGSSDYIKAHNQSKFDYRDFAIKSHSFHQPDRNVSAFNLKYSLQINGLARVVNGKFVFPIMPATPFHKYIEKDDLMKFYSVKRGLTVNDVIEVKLPLNYWIYDLPEPEALTSAYGSYKLATSFDGKTLTIKRTLVLYKGDYNKEDYEPFKRFFQSIEKLEKRKLVMNSKT